MRLEVPVGCMMKFLSMRHMTLYVRFIALAEGMQDGLYVPETLQYKAMIRN